MIKNYSVHKLLDILRNADYPEEDLAAILSRPNELSYVAVIDLLDNRDIKNISAFFNIMRKLIKSVIHTDQTVILLGKFNKEERDTLFAEAVKDRSLEVNHFSSLIEKERRLITDFSYVLSHQQKRSVLKHKVSSEIAQTCFRHQYELANDIFGNKYAARSKKIFDTLALNLKQNAIPLIETMFTQS